MCCVPQWLFIPCDCNARLLFVTDWFYFPESPARYNDSRRSSQVSTSGLLPIIHYLFPVNLECVIKCVTLDLANDINITKISFILCMLISDFFGFYRFHKEYECEVKTRNLWTRGWNRTPPSCEPTGEKYIRLSGLDAIWASMMLNSQLFRALIP